VDLDLNLNHSAPRPVRADFGIGAVGAGFIMRDVQLESYRRAGFKVVGITSRTPEIARGVADRYGLPKFYDTLSEMLRDPEVEILDIAVPPETQVEIVRQAVEHGPHLKGILAQKPLAPDYRQAKQIVDMCKQRGLALTVNQNMRYDQSIRALKTILERGYLGEAVLATIEMRAVPHWQSWLRDYKRLTLLNMSVHHIDTFRYLFGEPESIFLSARKDPRTQFPHEDGVCLYIIEYENGVRASAWDDTWVGPRTDQDSLNPYIKWRVGGTDGVAEGTIGWPHYPNHTPSTLTFMTMRAPNVWMKPHWSEVWFPDAFQGTMGELMDSIVSGKESPTSGRDNLNTMAIIDAGYLSLKEKRSVRIAEVIAAASVRIAAE
jgi:predicted dehydrogenase